MFERTYFQSNRKDSLDLDKKVIAGDSHQSAGLHRRTNRVVVCIVSIICYPDDDSGVISLRS